MKAERYTDTLFAQEINKLLVKERRRTVSPRSVAHWRKGLNIPRVHVARVIETFTNGGVKHQDHIDAKVNAEAAAA